MVIGFDGSRAFVGKRSGTENYSYQLLKALAKIDRRNQYLVYVRPDSVISSVIPANAGIQLIKSGSELDSRLRGNDKNEWPDNFQFKTIDWPRFWTQGGLALQTFRNKLDVLFVPAHTLPLIRKPGLKTVVTVHDLGSEYLPSLHQIKQRVYLGFMQSYQLKGATKIIAVSKATKEDLVKKVGIDPAKITVIYEGYDREKFKVHPSASLGTRNSKFKVNQTIKKYELMYQNYFLFVGTVQPRKNLERLVKAFSIIAARRSAKNRSHGRDLLACENFVEDYDRKSLRYPAQNPQHFLTTCDFAALKLVIAGSKGWMSDEIYALPKKLGIEDKVKFLGYVPEEDLPALYSGAVALTFPSLFEGFGLPILEAQASGCPVLTSNISSMPEVAGKGAVLVDPYSVDDIVEGMVRVKRKAERLKLVKAGLENIKRFSWEKCARETLKVLEGM